MSALLLDLGAMVDRQFFGMENLATDIGFYANSGTVLRGDVILYPFKPNRHDQCKKANAPWRSNESNNYCMLLTIQYCYYSRHLPFHGCSSFDGGALQTNSNEPSKM